MVVGGQYDVEACVDTGLQVFVGSAELRIAGVWLAAQRHLEVADGDVSTFHLVVDAGETLVVIIAAVLLSRSIDLWTVLHQVTSNQQAEVVFLSLLNCCGFCRATGMLRTARR